MTVPARSDPWSPEQIASAWNRALATWDVRLEISPPSPLQRFRHDTDEPLAFIDLATRQVFVNFELLDRVGARASLAAVLAHEVGHHVQYPHTLGQVARLRVLESQLMPVGSPSLLNLFFDLQVNEVVGRTMADDLCRVYHGFSRLADARMAPLFCFHLAIHEELWAKNPGTLVPDKHRSQMDTRFPGWQADARVFADTFFALPGAHLQFVYFCSRFLRYLDTPENNAYRYALSHDMPEPSVDDYAGALHGDPLADDALEQARKRGWISQSDEYQARSARSDDQVLTAIERATSHLPGRLIRPFRQALVGRHYRALASRYLFSIPDRSPDAPEPSLPTVTIDWEQGDALQAIDWTQSVLERGMLAAAMPLRREIIAEDAPPDRMGAPAAEIYLDTSGSMPAPDTCINAMTLAAQILALSVLRRGGRVRGIIYSSNVEASDWMYNEETVSSFLLRYAGGGTAFPFRLLRELAEHDRDVLRLVISDSDFLRNCTQAPENLRLLSEAIDRSARVVLLLALPSDEPLKRTLAPVWRHPRLHVVTVETVGDLAKAAAALANSFLDAVPTR